MVNIKAFTLIELMIVIAIIGVIAAFAYPSYREYIEKTNRTDVQSYMLQVAHQIENHKMARYSYKDAIIYNMGGKNYPKSGNVLYELKLTDSRAKLLTDAAADIHTWVITAEPQGRMNGTGVICLNHLGQKFWSKTTNTTTACLAGLTATSNWDGR